MARMTLVLVGSVLTRWRRRGVAPDRVLGAHLILAAARRFGIEFIRVNERVLVGLTIAHIVSLIVAAGGAALIAGSPGGDAFRGRGD
jgi:prolipoprotein diacylglyceryltransferase